MSELRTEAGLLIETLESRLLELRSLIPVAGADPAAPTDPTAAPTDPVAANCAHCGASAAGAPVPGNSCTGCPLCTLMAVLRGERPDLAGALLDGAVTALQMVRALVSEQPAPESAAAAPPTAEQHPAPIPDTAPPAAAQRRPPERIRIS